MAECKDYHTSPGLLAILGSIFDNLVKGYENLACFLSKESGHEYSLPLPIRIGLYEVTDSDIIQQVCQGLLKSRSKKLEDALITLLSVANAGATWENTHAFLLTCIERIRVILHGIAQ